MVPFRPRAGRGRASLSAMIDETGKTAISLQLMRPVICVVGPTASGKTDVAQLLARNLGGEVVSADSMQIYRDMDIGTGKLPEEKRLVPHFGFDLANPGEPYSAAVERERCLSGERDSMSARQSTPITSRKGSRSTTPYAKSGPHTTRTTEPMSFGSGYASAIPKARPLSTQTM